jgi:hypothetical protein
LEERLKELDQDILILSSRTESAEDALKDMRGLIQFMKETEDDQKRNEVRSRLRARLLSIIDRVEIAPAGYTSSPYERFQLMERVQKGEPIDPKVLAKGGHHALTHFMKADPEFLIEDGIPKKMIFKDGGGNVIEREIQPSGEPNEYELKSVMNDWLSDALGMVEGSEDLTKTQKGKVRDRLKEIFPIMMVMEMMDYERLTMGMSSKDKTRRNIGLRSFIIHFKSGKERVVGPAAFDVEQPDSEGLRDLTTIQEPDSIRP